MRPTQMYERAVASIKAEIVRRRAEIDALYSIAAGLGAKMDGERVQSSGGGDKLSNAIASVADKKREVEGLQERQYRLAVAMSNLIELVPSPDERTVLFMRYISGMKHEAIAAEISRSERQERRICRSGQESLEALTETEEYTILEMACQDVR